MSLGNDGKVGIVEFNLSEKFSIINAAQIVTLETVLETNKINEESLGLIEEGAIVVENGRVAWVGSMLDYDRLFSNKSITSINAEGKTVTPGFVDPHTHTVFAGTRETELDRKIAGQNYMDILKAGGGILQTIKETREASRDKIFNESRSRVKQLIMNGVTTLEIKTGYGQSLKDELKLLSIIEMLTHSEKIDIVPTFLGLHTVPPEFQKASDYVDYVIRDVLPLVSQSKMKPQFSDCFCEKNIFEADLCEKYLRASAYYGMRTKVHADEFLESGGAELAAKLGCVSADHLENSTREGLAEMAKSGVVAVLLPGTAFCSQIDPPDLKTIIDAGCQIALGTDICPNSWVESPQISMSIACNLMKLNSAHALVAATFGGALALGRPDVGRLVPGSLADIVIHGFPNYRFIPCKIGGHHVNRVYK